MLPAFPLAYARVTRFVAFKALRNFLLANLCAANARSAPPPRDATAPC